MMKMKIVAYEFDFTLYCLPCYSEFTEEEVKGAVEAGCMLIGISEEKARGAECENCGLTFGG